MKNIKIELKGGLLLALFMTAFVLSGVSISAYAEEAASDKGVDPIQGFVEGSVDTLYGLGKGTGEVISGFGEGTEKVVKGMGEGTKNAYEGVAK